MKRKARKNAMITPKFLVHVTGGWRCQYMGRPGDGQVGVGEQEFSLDILSLQDDNLGCLIV